MTREHSDDSIGDAERIYNERKQRREWVVQEFRNAVKNHFPNGKTKKDSKTTDYLDGRLISDDDGSFLREWESDLKEKAVAFIGEFNDTATERFLDVYRSLKHSTPNFDGNSFFQQYLTLSRELNPLKAFFCFADPEHYNFICKNGIDPRHYYENILSASEKGGKNFAGWYGYYAPWILRQGGDVNELLKESVRVHGAGGLMISKPFLYNASEALESGLSLSDFSDQCAQMAGEVGKNTAHWMARAIPLVKKADQDYDFESLLRDAKVLFGKNKKAALWYGYGLYQVLHDQFSRKDMWPFKWEAEPINIYEFRNNFGSLLTKYGLSAAVLYSLSTKDIGDRCAWKIPYVQAFPRKIEELQKCTTKKIFTAALWLGSVICRNYNVSFVLWLWNDVIQEFQINKNEGLMLKRIRFTLERAQKGAYLEGGNTIFGKLAEDLASNYIEVQGEEPNGEADWKEKTPSADLSKGVIPDWIEVCEDEIWEEPEPSIEEIEKPKPTTGLDSNGDLIF